MGDVVTINGTSGLVEVLTLRTIVLRDGTGTVHVFPHGVVTTLSNATRDWSAYIFNLQVAYRQDTDVAVQAIRDVFAELGRDPVVGANIVADVEIWGVDKLDGTAATIQGRIKTRPAFNPTSGARSCGASNRCSSSGVSRCPVRRPRHPRYRHAKAVVQPSASRKRRRQSDTSSRSSPSISL